MASMRSRAADALWLSLLALGGCRPSVPSADEFIGTSGTEGTGLGDDESTASTGGAPPDTHGSGSGGVDTGDTTATDASGSGSSSDDSGSSSDTTVSRCGDGIVSGDEDCDDGAETATCDADCTAVQCGDGHTNDTAGEACDERGATSRCDADCTLVECGDLVLNELAAEQCDGLELGGATCMDQGFTGGTLACDATCTLDTASCYACGDGLADPGEACDGDDLAGESCTSQGFAGGELACDPACSLDTTACYLCGDGATNPGEACDGVDLGGQTCETLGFDGGTLACDPTCGHDTSACYACGDGAIDPGEDCDGIELGGATCMGLGFEGGTLACTGACTFDTSECHWDSCQDVLDQDPTATSGIYTLDVDGGGGPIPPFSAYCDMDTDGGGWTELTPALGCTLGGQMVAVQSAVDFGVDAECRPYTRDEGGDHTHHYTIPFPPGFTQIMLVGYAARSNAGPGYTSDLTAGFAQSLWDQAYIPGGTGDISIGAAEQPGPITSFSAAGVVQHCGSCEIPYPNDGAIFTLPAESQALRLGWGEAGPEHEGWYPWWAGALRIR